MKMTTTDYDFIFKPQILSRPSLQIRTIISAIYCEVWLKLGVVDITTKVYLYK